MKIRDPKPGAVAPTACRDAGKPHSSTLSSSSALLPLGAMLLAGSLSAMA